MSSTASYTGSLGTRLDRIRLSKNHKKAAGLQNGTGVLYLPGWKQIVPFVSIKQDVSVSPFNNYHIKDTYPSLFPELIGKNIENLLFYDLETTGLSGGAGTIAFLAGFGWIENNRLIVNQYFLHDFPGEADFLIQIKDLLTEGKVLVSYNGKSFDHPLLKTRFLMKGLLMPQMPEIDLLHTARRLWKKKLPSCRLGIIEDSILGINRVDDIPGIEIPDIYFNYLKTSKNEQLERVFKHHLQDIKSLAFLLAYMENVWTNPDAASESDKTALGKLLLLKNRDEGLSLLKQRWSNMDYEAGKSLSLYHKRKANWAAAVEIWEEMWKGKKDLFQGLELAKYYEHKIKDIERAIVIVGKLREKDIYQVDKKGLDVLNYRLARLERKIKGV